MNTLRIASKIFALCILSLTFAAFAHAQTAQRTFVSTQGNDANTASLCGRNTPCRGFTAAISVVSAGGEVVALDSGGYGAVAITKSVQLVAPTGVYAAITATSGTAITINIGATDTVVLRGLTLNSLGANNGIDFQTGRTLHIESCVINGFTFRGINVSRNIANDIAEVLIKDTIVRNGGNDGISLRNSGSSSLVKTSIDNCRLEKNGGSGLLASDNARVTVRGSVAANNGFGFTAQSVTSGQIAEINLESCVATNSISSGLLAGGGNGTSNIRVSNSTITDNGTGATASSNGFVISRGNNTMEGNTSSNSFPAANTFAAK